MALVVIHDQQAEVETADNSTWTTITTVDLTSSYDQTFNFDFTIQARCDVDGISAAWRKLLVVDMTSNTLRPLSINLIDVLSPVKDTGALFWDVRATISGIYVYIQAKGGSSTKHVGWYTQGTCTGARGVV